MKISELMETSRVKFGTSGARGLVKDMTDEVCYLYTIAFLKYLESKDYHFEEVVVGGDLRPSTPRIMGAIAKAVESLGYEFCYAGFTPSPAVALAELEKKCPSIMVTGSHIPDDRNGIKFNTPDGEITKEDEMGFTKQIVKSPIGLFDKKGFLISAYSLSEPEPSISENYEKRYLDWLGPKALDGLELGFYEHSAVGRDCIPRIFESLGANVTRLARSEKFIPVDTEAIRPEDQKLAKKWAKKYSFDGIISTDGDSDRPILADENGIWLRGDVLGVLASLELKANGISTPVSCNSMVERCCEFDQVQRTKIGSPFVIAAMKELSEEHKVVVGYEANGGYLTQTSVFYKTKELKALPTRDAVLPVLATLLKVKRENISIGQCIQEQLAIVTYSDRIQEIPTEKSKAFLAEYFNGDLSKANDLFKAIAKAKISKIDKTDGVRLYFENDLVIHLRPSGNAPEFRIYAEAKSQKEVEKLVVKSLKVVKGLLS